LATARKIIFLNKEFAYKGRNCKEGGREERRETSGGGGKKERTKSNFKVKN
jgi:hypothetical protein